MECKTQKEAFEKHIKYDHLYSINNNNSGEYWGLGIENESYLMFDKKVLVNKEFMLNNHKRERYSVDYWKNFNKSDLIRALQKLPDSMEIPIYINSYLFQNADINGEHIKCYTKLGEANKKFNGITIDRIIKHNEIINNLFEKNIIYDGDTFEFATYYFYKTTVREIISELVNSKKLFLEEINKLLVNKGVFKDKIIYPDYNYGFVKYQSNLNNLAVCNNGTYHLNITLPTKLNSKNEICNEEQFKNIHSNAVRAIQWIEPLLIALYGTPDILHLLDSDFSGGSLRLMLSRYIGLGTYDTDKMIKGKLLNDINYKLDKNHYFNLLHLHSNYNPPDTIGYDFNYNKFKKHGIELRIFDFFPEEYLEDIFNLLLLVCQFSYYKDIEDPRNNLLWQDLTINCIKKGSSCVISKNMINKICDIFNVEITSSNIFGVLQELADYLYNKHFEDEICKKMSPNMEPIKLINYNQIVKNKFLYDVFKKEIFLENKENTLTEEQSKVIIHLEEDLEEDLEENITELKDNTPIKIHISHPVIIHLDNSNNLEIISNNKKNDSCCNIL
jgi:hypothetical protein